MDFPLIYCNGCSYSDENYASPQMKDGTYAHHLGKMLYGFTLNNAIGGSCNRRIIRSSTHDLLLQRKLNPDQQIIALIQLTFDLRSEVWVDELKNERAESESNFRTHQFTQLVDWKERLLSGTGIGNPILVAPAEKREKFKNDKFLKEYSEGRAFFYNAYAERINLLLDILLFTNLLKSNNIDYLIFAGPTFQTLGSEYMIDFLKSQLQDPRILDIEKFSFCEWCSDKGLETIDNIKFNKIGHFKPDAHLAFAEQVLLPKLKELEIIK